MSQALHATSHNSFNSVASPKLWWGKSFDFKRATVFVWNTASQSTKWQDMLEILWAWPLGPPSLRLWIWWAYLSQSFIICKCLNLSTYLF